MHHAYLTEVGFPPGTGMQSSAWQATCSPFRNPLDNKERTVMRFMASEPCVGADARAGARRRASSAPSVRWRYAHEEPWFDNQVATLELDGRHARVVLEKTIGPDRDSAEPEPRSSSGSSSATSADTRVGGNARKERANAPACRLP